MTEPTDKAVLDVITALVEAEHVKTIRSVAIVFVDGDGRLTWRYQGATVGLLGGVSMLQASLADEVIKQSQGK